MAKAQEKAATRRLKGEFQGITLSRSEAGALTVDVSSLNGVDGVVRAGRNQNARSLKHSLVAAFALAGVMALSPVSQALAGETSVTLGNLATATVQGGGTKVQTDANGNVKVYVDGGGSVTVYTDDGITVRPAVNDAVAAAPNAGDRLADGTIYAGHNFAATPADAPGSYTWTNGRRYCEDLEANGHDDWTLPTRRRLNHLYQNKNTGSFAGTFNEESSFLATWYWSSEELASFSSSAWNQSFTGGGDGWGLKDFGELSVRCVRAEPSAP